MTRIPSGVVQDPTTAELLRRGFVLVNQGKVRDTTALDRASSILQVVATNRISIFDFVLPALVDRKGEVLAALTHFWLTNVLADFPHHLLPIWDYRSQALPFNVLHVRRVSIDPWEMIFRGHIGGSVWAQYQETGMVAGHKLTPGLQKWQRLFPEPIFTPSTKEAEGHDRNVTIEEYRAAMGTRGDQMVRLFGDAYKISYKYAAERGILILDTKFEGGQGIMADEVLTPDSSRFTTVEDFDTAMREHRDPVFWDKELVRNWGRTVMTPRGTKGINTLNPLDEEDLAFVASLKVPPEIIAETTERYLAIFSMLVGISLGEYQQKEMIKK